jgi:hypothetical protein
MNQGPNPNPTRARPPIPSISHPRIAIGLSLALLVGLAGCAPATTRTASRAPPKQTSATNVNYQSFIDARGYKSVLVDALGPFSRESKIKPGSGQEWIIKLASPGKRLTLGVISSRGAVDFLLHGSRLTSNSPAHADTSGKDLKKLEFRNPAEGTYYVYALNRTRTDQAYTLVISLE